MKHLIIYTVIIFIIIGYLLYKVVEVVANLTLSTTEVEERLNYQLNIFKLERMMLDKMKFLWR